MSQETTKNITVSVEQQYIESRSDPKAGYYFFAYHVTVTNAGQDAVQLIGRHWIITDATGRIEHVRGLGVVGEQPIIQPGDNYTYTSFCPLPTAFGTMEGTYQMINQDGAEFEVQIAPFTLAHPHSIH